MNGQNFFGGRPALDAGYPRVGGFVLVRARHDLPRFGLLHSHRRALSHTNVRRGGRQHPHVPAPGEPSSPSSFSRRALRRPVLFPGGPAAPFAGTTALIAGREGSLNSTSITG